MVNYTFITPVWGGAYVSVFLEVGLPSLFANKESLRNSIGDGSSYQIYTTKNFKEKIEKNIFFQEISRFLSVNVEVIDFQKSTNHIAMSECHKKGMQVAYDSNSYATFIPPDCVWSLDSIGNITKIVERGYDYIYMTGLRLTQETARKDLNEYILNDGTLRVTSRELVNIALNNLHKITDNHFFNERSKYLMPSNLFWMVEGKGIIGRCFHLHPLVIKPTKELLCFHSTIDDDLVNSQYIESDKEYIIADSDELVAFELSLRSHNINACCKKNSIIDVWRWALAGANKKHRKFFRQRILIHANEVEGKDWSSALNEAELVANKVSMLLNPKDIDKSILKGREKSRYLAQVLYYLMIPYTFVKKKLEKCYRMYFGVLPDLKPWHWLSSIYNEVYFPIVNYVNRNSGKKTLLILSENEPLLNLFYNMGGGEHIIILTLEEFLSGNSDYSYADIDRVFCRVPSNEGFRDKLSSFLYNAFGEMNKEICLIAKNNQVTSRSFSKYFVVKETKNFGRLGHTLCVWYMNNIRKYYAGNERNLSRYAIMANYMLAPFRFVLYPIASVFVRFVNILDYNKSIWTEKLYIFDKESSMLLKKL